MTRYRKTMRQAIEEGLSNMQIAILKKEYAPLKGKKITAARAKQLMNILDKFKEDDLKKLAKANIPFVSSGSQSKLTVRNMKFKVTNINPFKEEVTQEDFDLEEGKMKTIATMFAQGKSAQEIAKKMGLSVDVVKTILGEASADLGEASAEQIAKKAHEFGVSATINSKGGFSVSSFKTQAGMEKFLKYMAAHGIKKEEEIHEFKKMTVTIQDMDKRKKAIADLMKQNLGVSVTGGVIKVDGKGRDLNNIAKDLMNFYSANVRAESYTIDESADEDFYNPITEACWVGYKQVGMKNKGGKQVPNCVPEETIKESTDINFNRKGAPVAYLKRFGRFSPDMKQYRMNGVNMTFWVYQGDDHPKSDEKFNKNVVYQLKLTSAYRPSNDKEYDKMYDVINKWGSERRLGKLNDKDVDIYFEEFIAEEDESAKEVEKLKKELEKSREQTVAVKQKAQTDAQKNAQRARTAQDKMVNPETGEPLLQVGIAYKHLKQKMEKEKAEQERREKSKKIADLASVKKDNDEEELEESAASDKAKSLGLDYMKFGRYGKDGKVTHKTSGDNLVKVGKSDEPKDDKPAKKPDAPKKDKDTGGDKETDIKVKSRNFIKDLEDGKLETPDGDPIEVTFDFEDFWDDAVEAARKAGLPELADELDGIAGSVMEMEPEEAQAEYQDMISKYSGKPVKSLEFAKKADEAIDLFTDSANADSNFGIARGNQMIAQNIKDMAKDLGNTFKIIQNMVDSDTTEGQVGGGNSNPMKGFRPEVLETIKSMESISDKLEEIKDEIDDEKTNDIISEIQGEIEFCTDDSADHDGYTKPHKVNSSIESISKLIKQIGKRTKEVNRNVPSKTKLPSGPKIQKDLENEVSDGFIDVDYDQATGELSMSREYEPSQEREAERDAEAVRDYLKKKGVKLNKDDIEIEKTDDYIQLLVNKNVNESFTQKILEQMKSESAEFLKPRMNPSQLANIKNVWKHKTKKDVTPAVKKMIKDMDIPTQLAIKHAKINVLSDLVEMAKDKAYAIGMATAKKKYNDEPPLDKKTIKKAHEIGDKLSKMKKENAPAAADMDRLKKMGMKPKKENGEHPAKMKFEQIAGLKKKADKSGMPYSILKKVYDRGMAAWRGGHRPGTTQQQWAFARVNSFVTKSSGTWGGADKDLAKQVRGSK